MSARPTPWVCDLWQKGVGWRELGRKQKKQAAQNLADRPFRSGVAIVENKQTGEKWVRRHGSWFCEQRPRKRAGAA